MGRLTLVLLMLSAFAGGARAQRVDSLVQVSGTVYDSVASKLLVGADLQFRRLDSLSSRAYDCDVGRERVDLPCCSEGAFPDGRFAYALYDSLGIDLPTREIEVIGNRSKGRSRLAIAKTIVRALCPVRRLIDDGSVPRPCPRRFDW